ncbi:MAG TPA: homocysteine S-methyltransferase family protein [Balneolales bacterium]|nr:homocysteine S-methyltransferase family protein [Balneolales bacterium]
MNQLLNKYPLVLMEAAVVEQLRRYESIKLHAELENALLIYNDDERVILENLYHSYLDVALQASLPFILLTPTWRANKERIEKSGITKNVNGDAVVFLKELVTAQQTDTPIKIGGLIGCKNDCYKPEEGLNIKEAEHFHTWQIEKLTNAGVDFLIAETLPAIPEAIGITKAMAKFDIPFIISFVIDRTGHVLDGTPLSKAMKMIDEITHNAPLGYMVNCSYPTFISAEAQPEIPYERLIGIQANASSLDQCDLDGSDQIHVDDIVVWGNEMLKLNKRYGVKILGGCCGTGKEHLQYLTDHMDHL